MEKIKNTIKEVTAAIIRYCGIFYFIRTAICRKKVTIVLYHNPSPRIFESHIQYMKRKFNIISLKQLVDAIYRKDWSGIPPRSLVITIDDGFKENYQLLDTFIKYNFVPTIYLCSHIVNTKRKLWFTTGFRHIEKIMGYTNNRRLNVLKKEVEYEPEKEYSNRQALNIDELSKMTDYVDFQAHSKFHPVLTTCNDNECIEELQDSKEKLQNLLKEEITHFSYPNGDYKRREIRLLKDSGYKSARTCDLGWNDINSNPFKLKAMGIQDDASINVLCAQLCGIFGYFRFLRNGSFNGKHPEFV